MAPCRTTVLCRAAVVVLDVRSSTGRRRRPRLGSATFGAANRGRLRADRQARRLTEEARQLRNGGKYDTALPLAERALAIREKALGPDHPDVALSLFNLAWLAKVKQDFAQAEALYKRALDIQERALGPDHRAVTTTLNDMAVMYNQRGDHETALQMHQRVLAIRERTLGPDDAGVALR